MRILVWTSRDIYSDGGERTYMFAKQRALERLGCTVAYVGSPIRRRPSADSNVLLAVNAWKLFAPSIGYQKLRRICLHWKPDVLVASGIWISHAWRTLARLRSEFGIPVSFDMHGALEELTEYNLAFDSRLISRLLFYACRGAEATLLERHADHIEVVSHNMEQYVRKTYPGYSGPISVVPCGIDSPIDDATYKRNRHRWRARLGLDPDRPAAVYSGSTAKWQRIADVVEFARAWPKVEIYLLLVGEPPLHLAELPENVKIASLAHSDAVDALCAFDFGFLLRRNDITNFVAFPNKAGEYLNARLRIVIDSDSIGCVTPELSGAFIPAAGADLAVLTHERTPFDLRSIVWSRLAAQLLSRYIHVRSGMLSPGSVTSSLGERVPSALGSGLLQSPMQIH